MSYIRDLRSENAKGNSVTNKAPMSPMSPMSPEDAARFLNEETAWPPGWTAQAACNDHDYAWASNGVNSRLVVTLSRESRNSSFPGDDGNYREPFTLQFLVGVPRYALRDKDALVFYLLEKIVWCEEHEDREFTRYKREDGTWYAPFHPHRGNYTDQHRTPEWQAQYRDPADPYIAGRKPKAAAIL